MKVTIFSLNFCHCKFLRPERKEFKHVPFVDKLLVFNCDDITLIICQIQAEIQYSVITSSHVVVCFTPYDLIIVHCITPFACSLLFFTVQCDWKEVDGQVPYTFAGESRFG